MDVMNAELLAGRYELLDAVGKGATGEVWRATDTLLERMVAVKIVQIEGSRDPAIAARFRREGVAIAGVQHPAIVQVFDAGIDSRCGWLVMELLAGPNTNALVKQEGPLGFEVGLPLLAQVASGLQAAHDQGVTHRDVKPANIVLNAAPEPDGTRPDLMAHPELGHPVLVDFGIARLVDESGTQLTRPATAIGTAAYMSPEQARGKQVGPPSDVYSLACVAYHLLLGRPPFVADSSLAIAHAQAFDPPTPMIELDPATPPALNMLLLRMLDKDPARRPTAAEVASGLAAIAANPQLAPTVVLPGSEDTEAMTAPTEAVAGQPDAGGGQQPVPEQTGEQQPVPEQTGGQRPAAGQTGIRTARRLVMVLLLIGMAIALAYSWLRPDPPSPPHQTVTFTTTEVSTHVTEESSLSQPPTATSASPVTEAPVTSEAPITGQPATSEPTATYASNISSEPTATGSGESPAATDTEPAATTTPINTMSQAAEPSQPQPGTP